MRQAYENYTTEDLEVWQILYNRQIENLKGKVHPYYYECLDKLKAVLNGDRIPEFDALEDKLASAHGWTIEVVPGIIPVNEFFELLSQRKFCSSTWLRKKSQLDYLEEPDMFHDIFGHIPLLMNKDYADFMHRIGVTGVQHKGNEKVILELKRLYWFTVEFGLTQGPDNVYIIGAGTISSYGETNHIYNDDVIIHPFDVEQVVNKAFDNSVIQNEYFALPSFDELYATVDDYARKCLPVGV